jgi:hypothetical protein
MIVGVGKEEEKKEKEEGERRGEERGRRYLNLYNPIQSDLRHYASRYTIVLCRERGRERER